MQTRFSHSIVKSYCNLRAHRIAAVVRRFSLTNQPQLPKHSKYPHLLDPLVLHGDVVLRNRSLMGSMHTGLEEPGLFGGSLDEMAAFYGERAAGGVGLIVTGGISPNNNGRGYFGASKMTTRSDAAYHDIVTDAVHKKNGKIAMQILHTGRYAYHPWPVSASSIKSPISPYKPQELSRVDVYQTIDDFVNTSVLAKSAGYDGVEIMGSEGYLINQFLVERTNKRTDEWGGSYQNRMRFPTEIVRRVREAVGDKFIIVYRLSMLDLVENGSSWEQIVELAHNIERAGASIINTGIGWHEARIPTIATSVPRGAFTWVTKKMKGEVNIPLCTTNRINNPETAEEILASGAADMVSLARPFLADPYFMKKAEENRSNEINTCIGCNQACLDHIFLGKRASCLVNPLAAHETDLVLKPTSKKMKIAVVGAGPAGLAFATTAASRGHSVVIYEKDTIIGGQFNMAKMIPGKEEFFETLRYFDIQLKLTGVTVKLNTTFTESDASDYDAVVVATGVTPRDISLPNKSSTVNVVSYVDVLKNKAIVGKRVAVIGAGGIGYDVSEYLTHSMDHPTTSDVPAPLDQASIDSFLKDWSIDTSIKKGGLLTTPTHDGASPRKIYLLQRKTGKLGKTLGKTTGWIHKAAIKKKNVEEISGCKYIEVTNDGLVITANDKPITLPVDTVVLCAGQEPYRNLFDKLKSGKKPVFMIGGAQEASELDAKRAIDQATRLAAVVESAKTGDVFMAENDIKYHMMQAFERYLGKK